jgi:hypothetical protein
MSMARLNVRASYHQPYVLISTYRLHQQLLLDENALQYHHHKKVCPKRGIPACQSIH